MTVCLIGLDEPEAQAIKAHLDVPVIIHTTLPGIMVKDGELWVEKSGRPKWARVSAVIYHGIFEDDLDFIAALALWGGACFPNPRAMMDCRLRIPCLVRALQFTRYGLPLRGFASPYVYFSSDEERVAKWGNWHAGENKERFIGTWNSDKPALIEHFLPGEAVRIVMVGEQAWQIRQAGEDWLKSIHHEGAEFMELDPDLLADTKAIKDGFGLEIIGNDYIIGAETKHLLEVNHIPNLTRFPELWTAYEGHVVAWIRQNT
jgi:hypothetical protein